MEEQILLMALKMITANPSLLNGNMPNLPLPTMGGHTFWNNLAVEKGWKVQQNMLTHHVRILDDNDVRRAWGSEEEMMKLFRKIVK